VKDPKRLQQCVESAAQLRPNISDYVALHAAARPHDVALIEHNTGEQVTWRELERAVEAFAAKLLAAGLRKGDVVATSLPLLKEHVYLIYACYRIGVVIAPFDLRLRAAELRAFVARIAPKAYFFVGVPKITQEIREVMAAAPSVRHWVQFQKESDGILPGAVWVKEFTRDIKRTFLLSRLTRSVARARRRLTKRDPCLIIFTTGSTGSPKPAVLCHENILLQNVGLAAAFEVGARDRMLVNLPPSHVGGTTEQLATILYTGGTAVLLHIFDARDSLAAIAKQRVTMLGQIPALYNMEWRLARYRDSDLSSLRFAIYGGQAVPRPFLVNLKGMAPLIGTGLGLTETAGFCTYTDVNADVDELEASIGWAAPFCRLSIRAPIRDDGYAGEEKAPGETGEVCFFGPQVFLGYMNDQESTAKALSKDGFCYTGDLGSYDARGLRFAGRSKLAIKSRGYQIMPEDVEQHIARKLEGRVGAVAAVGVEHDLLVEAVMVFAEAPAEGTLLASQVAEACRDMASYSRPSHVEIVQAGSLPLNRVAKTDYLELKRQASEVVARLRAEGHWDRGRALGKP
jgi:fatty-acyl-CoA synthase